MKKFSLFFIFSLAFLFCTIERAQSEQNLFNTKDQKSIQKQITDIFITGNVRIPSETIEHYLTFKRGDFINQETINQSSHSLYETGLFLNINVEIQGTLARISLSEAPVINSVSFEGLNIFSAESFMDLIKSQKRRTYSRFKVESDSEIILEEYRKNGYYATSIEPMIIEAPGNLVDVIFSIEEGSRTQIKSIKFIGNNNFSDENLRHSIISKEVDSDEFNGKSIYNPNQLEKDKARIRNFYLNNGYADIEIFSVVAELSPNRKDFFITFTLDEGDLYYLGKIEVSSNIKEISNVIIQPNLYDFTGKFQLFRMSEIEEMAIKLRDMLLEKKFRSFDIFPNMTRRNQTTDIEFQINTGEQVIIEEILIYGAVATPEAIILKNLEFKVSDFFSTYLMRKSKDNLTSLGVFDEVGINLEPGSGNDKIVVNINLKELEIFNDIQFSSIKSNSRGTLLGPQEGIVKDRRTGATYGRKIALVIGVSDYYFLDSEYKSFDFGTLIDLKFAEKDANDISNLLQNESMFGDDWTVHLLTGSDATEINVGNKIDEVFAGSLNEQDLIVLFFAGHARLNPNNSRDVRLFVWDSDPKIARAGISYSELRQEFFLSSAGYSVAFIDACRSGSIGLGRGFDRPDQDLLGEIQKGWPTKVMFTAGSGAQQAFEDPELQNGVFTHYLIRGLAGEAENLDDDNYVDLDELEFFVATNVEKHTSAHSKMARQTPRLFDDDGLYAENFPLAIRVLEMSQ